MFSRKLTNHLLISINKSFAALAASILLVLLAAIFYNGAAAITWEFLTTGASNFGAEGGIFYQITGSLLLILGAAGVCVPIAIGAAIYKSEYVKSDFLQKSTTLLIFGLNGIPSIVFGLFGLIFFVHILGTGISWFAGSIILATMILPTVLFATYQSMYSIPANYRESALALGLNKWQVVVKVVLPQGVRGALTCLLIGLARAVGETAPIMFIATAFSGVELPGSLFEPVVALPTHILTLSQQATDAQALQNAWGAGLVLICLVLSLSLSALFARTRLQTLGRR